MRDEDKRAVVFLAKQLATMGFDLVSTPGTARFLSMNGVAVERVSKLGEGRRTVVDLIRDGDIQLILNTPLGKKSKRDERSIRLAAMERGVP